MKTITRSAMLFIMTLMVWNGSLLAQIPPKVEETFTKMFQKALDVKWELDDDLFVVKFTIDEKKVEAVFEKSGKWTETKTQIELSKLSDPIKEAISKKFDGSKLDEAVFVETDKSKYYEVGISTKDENYLFVSINEKGKILSYY